MSNKLGPVALAAAFLVAGVGIDLQGSTARAAEDCLAAPNSRAPQGSHWYYRTDRVKQSKCWYLRSQGETAQPLALAPHDTAETAPAASSAPASSAPAPLAKPGNVAPAAALGATKPQPAITSDAAPDDGAQTPVQQGAQESAAQQAAPAPAASVKWPDAAPQPGVLQRAAPVANPAATNASPMPAQPAADVAVVSPAQTGAAQADAPRADAAQADAAQADAAHTGAVQADAPNSELNPEPAGWMDSLTATPAGIFLIAAIGLAMAGILSRAIIRIASARRPRVYVDPREQRDWMDYIPPEHAPPLAARPVDITRAPAERVSRAENEPENELDFALRQFLRERDRRVA